MVRIRVVARRRHDRQKKERFIAQYGLTAYDAKLLTEEVEFAELFSETLKLGDGKNFKEIANWINGAVRAYLGANNRSLFDTKLTAELLAKIMVLVQTGKISLQTAKEKLFIEVIEKGHDPEQVMREKGLAQVSDTGALDGWIQEVIAANPKVVEDFKSGKETAAMFLVGQVMKKSQGKANPGMVRERVIQKLKEL